MVNMENTREVEIASMVSSRLTGLYHHPHSYTIREIITTLEDLLEDIKGSDYSDQLPKM